MGWSIGYDSNWQRDIGYGVPALCDHPKCSEKIDRGLAYVCGDGPYGGDNGCGLFFCSKHKRTRCLKNGDYVGNCPRCIAYKPPYKHLKPDHPEWIKWKLTDESWQQWCKKNPEEVIKLKKLYGNIKI